MYKRSGNWMITTGKLKRGWQFNLTLEEQISVQGNTRIALLIGFASWFLEIYYDAKKGQVPQRKAGILRFFTHPANKSEGQRE